MSFSTFIKGIFDKLPFSPWLIIIPVVLIILTFLYFRYSNDEEEVVEEYHADPQNGLPEGVIFSRYAGGHPKIEEFIQPCLIYYESDKLHICSYSVDQKAYIAEIGAIPRESITEVRVDDSFAILKKITKEQWKKLSPYFRGFDNYRDEDVGFLVIDWHDGKEQQSTYFSIEVPGSAMEYTLRKRNALVGLLRQQTPQVLEFS